MAGALTGHSCSFSQTAETLPIYKPEVCHDGLKLWKCEWDLVHEGLDNTRIISFTCCWVYWFPHDPLTLQTSADKVKKHKVVNRGTLKGVKYDSLGFCGRMIHGSLVVLRSSEGTVITSHTYTHLLCVRWGHFAWARGLGRTGNQGHAITARMRFSSRGGQQLVNYSPVTAASGYGGGVDDLILTQEEEDVFSPN